LLYYLKQDLKKDLKDLDQSVRDVCNSIGALVEKLANKEKDIVDSIERTAAAIMMNMPFASSQTRLMSFRPHYVPITPNTEHVFVQMEGLFPCVSSYSPTLKINEQTLTAFGTQDNLVTFRIPVNALLTSNQLVSATRTFTYAQSSFDAPYNSGWGWFSTKNDTCYPVSLGILPVTPGKITISYQVTKTGTIERPQQSQSYFESAEHRGPTLYPVLSFFPSSGWKYKTTPTVTTESFIGHYAIKSVVLNSDGTQCTVSLELGGGDWENVGRLHFHLNWTEYQEVKSLGTRTDVVTDLPWGNSRMFSPIDDSEMITKIHFEDFNDEKWDFFPTSQSDNPFIRIDAQDGSVIISAVVPSNDQLIDDKTLLKKDVQVKKQDSVTSNKELHIQNFLEASKTFAIKSEATCNATQMSIDHRIAALSLNRKDYKSIQEAREGDKKLWEEMRILMQEKTFLENRKAEKKRISKENMQINEAFLKLKVLENKEEEKKLEKAENSEKPKKKE